MLILDLAEHETDLSVGNERERERDEGRNQIFPWPNCQEIDALVDLMGLDLGKRGKMVK